MRIAIDTRDLQIAKTGTRTYLEELCKALPLASQEDEIIFLSPKLRSLSDKSSPLKIINHIAFYWWKEVELPWLAWRNQCDILLCTDYVVPLFPPCPAVPVFHDAGFWERPFDYNLYWRILLNLFGVAAARKSPAVITVSHTARQRIAHYTGLPMDKLVVIYNAPKYQVVKTLCPKEVHRTLRKHGLTSETPFILHVGVMEKRKNLPRLVRAFKLALPEIGGDYRLVLVGQPGPKQDLDDSRNICLAIERSGLTDHVFLLGYLPDEELAALYQAARLYVLPSLYEGFGIPAVEAMANGVPVVASKAASIPEVVGEAALLFDPEDLAQIKDAIVRGIVDRELREKLVASGRVRAGKYSWEYVAKTMLELFKRVTLQTVTEG